MWINSCLVLLQPQRYSILLNLHFIFHLAIASGKHFSTTFVKHNFYFFLKKLLFCCISYSLPYSIDMCSSLWTFFLTSVTMPS